MSDLDALIDELEEAARRLESGGLDGEEAAALVAHVADLVRGVGSRLDRQARDVAIDPSSGQESLL